MENVAKSDANDNRKMVLTNDFVINSRSDRKQSCGVSPLAGSVSLINTVLYPAKGAPIVPAYLNYLLKNYGFAEEFYRWGHGIVADLWTTRWQEMKSILLPVPSMEEQQQILNTISAQTDKIDALIANVQAQIEKLKIYKKSLVIECVTKGMHPCNNKKTIKIEWISEMPAHWEECRIKNVIFPKDKPVLPTDQIITCFRDGEVTLRSKRREDGFTVSFTEHGYHGVDIGDLVVHGMDAFAGAIGCSDSRGKTTPVVHVCHTAGNNRYFMYYLRAMAYGNILMDLSNGVRIRSSDYRNFDRLGVFGIAVPPRIEQDEIVNFLDEKCSMIDSLIVAKQAKTEKLEQYKRSLIYEYVTGKKEVS
ncbi:MAG: restriction endonuclease subunit S [Ruminococcaceae bacterium]|nr:restriction endonuclease subunit S [Oscillospiraceae bacterium]